MRIEQVRISFNQLLDYVLGRLLEPQHRSYLQNDALQHQKQLSDEQPKMVWRRGRLEKCQPELLKIVYKWNLYIVCPSYCAVRAEGTLF